MSLGSELFESAVKLESRRYHNPKTDLSLLRQHFIDLSCSCCHHDYEFQFTDGTTATFYMFVLVIWMHRFQEVIISRRNSELFHWKSVKSQTLARETMVPYYVIVPLAAMCISTVIGFFTNLFIIVAHGMDRVKGRNVNPRELILFTLGVFNITFQCTMVANDTTLFLWRELYFSDKVYTIFIVILFFTIFSSFWFTFCLCGFYYVMLVTLEQKFFIRLKQGISHVVPWMLTFSVILSLSISLPVVWNITKEAYPVIINGNLSYNSLEDSETNSGFIGGNFSYNATVTYSVPRVRLGYLVIISTIGCCIPLLLVAVTNVLIIKALCIHAKRLGKSSGGMSVQSVEASVSAAWTVTSLLLLYISFYVSEILLILEVFKVDSPWMTVCLVIVYSYSPVLSLILIFGSPKLKGMTVRMFCPTKPTDNGNLCKKIDTLSSSVSSLTTTQEN